MESPLQNSAVQGAGPSPASSPPGSQVALATPSGFNAIPPGINATLHNSDNDETLFFRNTNYKKHYFALSKLLSKQEKSFSRVWFLKTCIKLNILPPTSAIKANHNIRFTDTASKRFQNNLINTSLQNLKIGLEEEKIFLESCKCEFRNSKIRMHSSISEIAFHAFIENRLKSDQSRLKKQFYNMHRNKLVFLLTKSDKPIPNFLKDQSPNVPNGSKKSRKFIRRTRYRRRIKQLNRRKNCLVINYSDIELSKDMKSLLNRGLNFAVIPKKVNTTDVHAGFEKLSRSMKWKESKYKDDDKNTNPSEFMSYKKEPWRKSNTNLPLTAAPADLSTMLNGSLALL